MSGDSVSGSSLKRFAPLEMTSGNGDMESGSSAKQPKTSHSQSPPPPPPPLLKTVQAVDSAVTKIQKYLTGVLNLVPAENELHPESDPWSPAFEGPCPSEIRDMLRSPRLILARFLKSYHSKGKLPILDQILETAPAAEGISHRQTFGHAQIRALSAFTQSTNRASSTGGASTEVSNFSDWPPSLPEINNPQLLNQIFTHKSVANQKQYLSRTQLLAEHNERLEFLGDSVLNSTMSVIAYNRFPDMAEGDLTTIKSSLVSNEQLYEWSKVYGLDKRLHTSQDLDPANDGGDNNGHNRLKMVSDVFEAYIAGVFLDSASGVDNVTSWLKALAEPLLSAIEINQKSSEPLNRNAKNDLYVAIGSASLKPVYDIIHGGVNELYKVTCIMGNEVIGIGHGPNSKEAGIRAAMNALKDKNIIEKYAELRRSTPRELTIQANHDESLTHQREYPLPYQQPTDTSIFVQSGHPQAGTINTSDPQSASFSTSAITEEIKAAKANLYALIGSEKQKIIYKTEEHPSGQFESTLIVRNNTISTGSGRTKKSAEGNAALNALQEKALMEQLLATKWS